MMSTPDNGPGVYMVGEWAGLARDDNKGQKYTDLLSSTTRDVFTCPFILKSHLHFSDQKCIH